MEGQQTGDRAVPEQQVPVNVWETDHALVVVAPMPGVSAEDVTVRLQDGVLHLFAELRTAAPKDYLIREWHYGSYVRSVPIGPDYGAPMTTSFGNGLLAVSIPRLDADAVQARSGGGDRIERSGVSRSGSG